MERTGWKKGYSERYAINYKYIDAFGGITCEFSYNDRQYGFTARPKLINTNDKKGKFNMESNEAALNRELDNIMNYLIINEKEKKEEKRVDKINSKNNILFTISENADCYYEEFTTSNENMNKCLNPYVHDGMTSTYFIIRIADYNDILSKKEKNLYFSYNPYFRTLDFEDLNDAGYDLFVKNKGKECMLFSSYHGVMVIRPGETVKYCRENIYKGKITCPTCYGRDITYEKK